MTGSITHGHTCIGLLSQRRTREYNAWCAMRARCADPKNDRWPRYGGRGIRVCERWLDSFEAFLSDMGRAPTQSHQIDRFPDNDGNYEPGNCRWATREEQANRRSNNRFIEYGGDRLTAAQWAKRLGMEYSCLMRRLDDGWPLERALDPSVKRRVDPTPKAPKPKLRNNRTANCVECGTEFLAQDKRSRFCSSGCRTKRCTRDWHNANRDRINADRRAKAASKRMPTPYVGRPE